MNGDQGRYFSNREGFGYKLDSGEVGASGFTTLRAAMDHYQKGLYQHGGDEEGRGEEAAEDGGSGVSGADGPAGSGGYSPDPYPGLGGSDPEDPGPGEDAAGAELDPPAGPLSFE